MLYEVQNIRAVFEKKKNGTELGPLAFVEANFPSEESQSDMSLSRLDNLESLPTH